MTTRLQIYNGALLLCGELRLNESTGLTENREARYLLDEVWDGNGIRYCLEQAQWFFAMRTVRLDFDPSITPAFGLKRAFDKPDDWVLTSGVFQDEFMNVPLLRYADESGLWYAELDEIFVRYISDDSSFGGDLSRWPETFVEYVKAYFASRIVHRVKTSAEKIVFLLGPPGRESKGHLNHTLITAKNKAAMALPTTFPMRGTWALARHQGLRGSYRDGGNITSLIG